MRRNKKLCNYRWPLDFVGVAGEPPDPRPYRQAVSAGLDGSRAERVKRIRTLQELLSADGRASQAQSLDSLVYDEITGPVSASPEPSESAWPIVPWP